MNDSEKLMECSKFYDDLKKVMIQHNSFDNELEFLENIMCKFMVNRQISNSRFTFTSVNDVFLPEKNTASRPSFIPACLWYDVPECFETNEDVCIMLGMLGKKYEALGGK